MNSNSNGNGNRNGLIRSGGGQMSERAPFQIEAIPDTPQDELSFDEILQALRNQKKWIYGSILGAFILALVVSLIMTPKYEATAMIEIDKDNTDAMDALGGLASGGGDSDLDYNVTLQTQASVLQSRTLALRVIAEQGLEKRKPYYSEVGWLSSDAAKAEAKEPLDKAPIRREKILKKFSKNLDVTTVPGTRILNVAFRDPDPQVAANVVNSLVSDYTEQYFRSRYASTMQASDWIGKQIDDLKHQAETSQKKLADYQKEFGILGADASDNVVMNKLRDVNTQLTAAEANRISKEALYQLVKTGDPELISGLAGSQLLPAGGVGSAATSMALIQNLRQQEAGLKVEYASAATKYGAAYPRLVQIRNQLKDIDATIKAEVAKIGERAENDYRTAASTEGMLKSTFERQKQEANNLTDNAVKYTILKQEAESTTELYQSLLKRLHEAGVIAGLHSTNINVVDSGQIAGTPVRPNYPLNLALGVLAGLLIGTTLAFVADSRDESLRTPEQLERRIGLPLLGMIPSANLNVGRLKIHLGKKLILPPETLVFPDSGTVLAESYRALRTAILLSDTDKSRKVLLVTSALPAEGKTVTSVNLAYMFAQKGHRVLLVDADLRRPRVHHYSGQSNVTGLTTTLNDSNSDPAYVQHPTVASLYILTAGPRCTHPVELLGSARMSELIERWRSEFDYVIIDVPPVMLVTDAAVLAPLADGVIVVARYGTTTTKSLFRSTEMLRRTGAPLTGAVLNDVARTSQEQYHYSYYSGDRDDTEGSKIYAAKGSR